ncbi:MAG: 3-phosphoshikimate 1-carboxyvinyltransferase [Boseongicola sp.]|nr:3-phosphoshikimate 1-carboxyvinyltransferase [Boseongicola sp.]
MSGSGAREPMIARRAGALSGEAHVPGDKSISHRSLILGAMCVGETRIEGLLEGEDVLATAAAMRAFGAEVVDAGEAGWSVHGVGVGGFGEPADVINCGNSGTGARLVMGAMATTPITATFTGDASLRSRPMGRVTEPLAEFGARAVGQPGGRLPMTITGAKNPVPVNYTMPVASAQVKSAILLAGLNAPGETVVIEREATRDHTERMLRGFGAGIDVGAESGGRVITLKGHAELRPQVISVPRDPSSAAFPVATALIVEGSDVLVPNVGMNPTRTGFFSTLREMGADLSLEDEREEGGEPVADIRARFSPGLKGIEVPPERAASMIDEYPILSVVSAFAEGRTVMRGVGELRVKESDRIDAMATGLRAVGGTVREGEDWWEVEGMGPSGVPGGACVEARLDHRIAMSFLSLGLGAKEAVTVDDAASIATSFPTFAAIMTELGASLEPVQAE